MTVEQDMTRTQLRLKRALTRAGYSVVKKQNGRVPQTDFEITPLRKAYVRILEHARRLGWLL
jgi:hypothetical protein